MPELPEVEVLVRHLRPLLKDKTIRTVQVNRPTILRSTVKEVFHQELSGARFQDVRRRGKYLVFELVRGTDLEWRAKNELPKRVRPGSRRRGISGATTDARLLLLGHLGMTGRMYLLPSDSALPKHAAVVFDLGREKFI